MLLALSLPLYADEAPERAPVRWAPTRADYVLTRLADGTWQVDATLRVVPVDPEVGRLAWLAPSGDAVAWTSVGGGAHLENGQVVVDLPAGGGPIQARARGVLTPAQEGSASLEVTARVTVSRVTTDAGGYDVRLPDAPGGFAPDDLAWTWAPRREHAPAAPETLVVAETVGAAWGDEGAVAARTRVRFQVLRGERSRFRVRAPGLSDVEVTGANVARWSRAGDVLEIETLEPVRGVLAVDVSGRVAGAGQARPFPLAEPLEVRRNRVWRVVGRSDEGELIPESSARSVAVRALPEWGRAVGDTTPLAAWEGTAPLTVRAANYEAVMGRDMVVEEARFIASTNADGRLLLRATWLVRNERSQYLHVVPPAGWSPLTARVTGTPVSVLSDGAGGVYVPLEKSLETVKGLLSFPVEVTWLAEGQAWGRRGDRALVLPSVNAPIQGLKWEVHLPRGYREDQRRRDPAAAASSAGPADFSLLAADKAQVALDNATKAYRSNDFEAAQEWVHQAVQEDADNEQAAQLQGNLDVLLGGQGNDDTSRRVRELANAKTVDEQARVDEVERKADEALAAGDEVKALGYLEEAYSLSSSIAITQQAENTDLRERAASTKTKMEKAKVEVAKKMSEKDAAPEPDSGRFEYYAIDGNQLPEATGGIGGGEGELDASGTVEPPTEIAEEEEPYAAEPVAIDTATASTGEVLTKDFLQRVPAGRSYQSTTAAAPGIAAGKSGAGARAQAAGRAPPPAAPPPPPPSPTTVASPRPAPAAEDAPEKPADGDARPALAVNASPLTPALPLDTPSVVAAQALLPAGETPTLTVRYRMLRGDP